ncbi:MAG: glucosamine-6-phosphate deaminase [Eubacteriales bacterium]|nr:glucosamine-6-phosphate deaminase [Eubacteriales bacterium]
MRIHKTKNYDELSRKAADLIFAQVMLRPACVLGLATGSTPIGTYQCLIQDHQNKGLDFSQVVTVNLDEYRGLTGDNDQSYRYFMNHQLFHHINIPLSHTNVPNGIIAPDKACDEYERLIRNLGGIDMQVLGLGHNGHIGFNEPADHFVADTHQVDLAQKTIDANTRFFANVDAVPRQAITMGIGTIMKARKILLLVSGEEKADILNQVINGPITPLVPASILQLHPDVTVIADEAALSKTAL